MLRFLFLITFICFSFIGIGQSTEEITWKTLTDVTFYEEYNEEFDFNVLYPKFGKSILALDGKEVIIEGYAIPIDELGYEDILVLSAMPYSQCFFCGMAGPESVMDIKVKEKLEDIRLDKKLRLKGRLKLNVKDLSQLNYILLDAVLVD
jgi:hypothetical protein